MGVYIKGVEIPKSCAGCVLYRFGYTMKSECWNMCAASGKDIGNPFNIGRPDWCPLIHVSQHGRLIDADELIDRGFQLVRDNIFTGVFETVLLSSVPTVIEAEEET